MDRSHRRAAAWTCVFASVVTVVSACGAATATPSTLPGRATGTPGVGRIGTATSSLATTTPTTPATSTAPPIPTPLRTDGPTATAAPPASSSPATTDTPASHGPTSTATPSAQVLGWSRLHAGGALPAAREDHTWTVDADAQVAYLFGGRDGAKVFDDLWSFDLMTDTWAKLDPVGEHPAARFGHTATWVPGTGLVIWAGQAGGSFFGDLWTYDPTEAGWRQLPADGAVPEKRYGSCAALGPDGRLWISHGFTDKGRFFDTRAYDFGAGAWSDVTPNEPRPVDRCLHDCFWTPTGKLLLFGGQTTGVAALGDLWSLTPGVGGPGTWAPLPKPDLGPRQLYADALVGGKAYVFGGSNLERRPLDDLWVLDLTDLSWHQVANTAREAPRARAAATLIADPARARLLLWGGNGDGGSLDDLWQLSLPAGG